MKEVNKVKELGQIFTPVWCADLLMDRADYKGKKILNKKVLEPSAGDGQIVLRIMQRLIDVCNLEGLTPKETKKQLKNIYAIELDPTAYKTLLEKTKKLLIDNKISQFKMNFFNEDSLKKKFKFKFDFIIGNPPYVRTKNIPADYRTFLKSNFKTAKGSYDLYFIFYEKSIDRIKPDGIISFITPNYYKTKVGNEILLDFFIKRSLLKEVIHFDFYVFENARVSTSITVLQKCKLTTKYISPEKDQVNKKWERVLKSISDFSDINFDTSYVADVEIEFDIKIENVDVFMTNKIVKCDSKHYYFKDFKIEKELIRSVSYKKSIYYYIDIASAIKEDYKSRYPRFNQYVEKNKILDIKKFKNKTPELKERLVLAMFIYKEDLKMEITDKKHKQYFFRITSNKYSNETLKSLINEKELLDFAKETSQLLDNGAFKIRISTLKQYLNYKIEQYENELKVA